MAADYITQQQEEDHRARLMREAAIHMLRDEKTESEAIAHVESIQALRENAKALGHCVINEDGFVESYLEAELDPPSAQGLDHRQIYSVHQKLLQGWQ